jgi:hypothetical protein
MHIYIILYVIPMRIRIFEMISLILISKVDPATGQLIVVNQAGSAEVRMGTPQAMGMQSQSSLQQEGVQIFGSGVAQPGQGQDGQGQQQGKRKKRW